MIICLFGGLWFFCLGGIIITRIRSRVTIRSDAELGKSLRRRNDSRRTIGLDRTNHNRMALFVEPHRQNGGVVVMASDRRCRVGAGWTSMVRQSLGAKISSLHRCLGRSSDGMGSKGSR